MIVRPTIPPVAVLENEELSGVPPIPVGDRAVGDAVFEADNQRPVAVDDTPTTRCVFLLLGMKDWNNRTIQSLRYWRRRIVN